MRNYCMHTRQTRVVCCFRSVSGFTLFISAAVFLSTFVIFYEWGSDERLVTTTLSGRIFGSGTESFFLLGSHNTNNDDERQTDVVSMLIQKGIYSENDFVNDLGLEVPYWNQNGPCFATHQLQLSSAEWDNAIIRFYNQSKPEYHTSASSPQVDQDLEGYCRPGFIIIGAGKCGTSSLYHYLVDHPRILPASEKQIHYFRYYAARPMRWYLHHFPTATSFLAAGALLTGEASPG